MAQVQLSRFNLKGPTGSATTNKRVIVSRANIHGPIDKRVRISAVSLVAPPKEARVIITAAHLVGASSALRPLYYGSPSGWVPIDVYVPGTNGTWTKVT